MVNVVQYISPPVTNFVDNQTINTFGPECIGPDIRAIDDGFASAVYSADLIIYVPFSLVERLTVNRFFWINGATAAGNTDVGIYSLNGLTKLGSSGSTANSGTNAIQVVDVADFILPAVVPLWLAIGCDSATHTFYRANLVAQGLDLIGVKQQASGWSSGLPATATLNTPSVDYLPIFGFTEKAVI